MADGEPVSKRLRQRKDTNTSSTSKPSAKSTVKHHAKSPASSSSTSATVPTPGSTSNSLLCLTDDCLQKLFMHLDVESLCQMANVCKRLKPIAEQVFSECHKKFVFKGRSCKNSVFRRVLCKFGHLITSIDASEANFAGNEKLDVNAIAKYCINNLEELKLCKATINCDVVKPLFSRLKRLDLSMCEFTGNKTNLFKNCSKLEFFGFDHDFVGPDEFNVDFDRSIDFVVRKFPKLESIAFDCSYTAFWAFINLLKLNPQVKYIDIIAPAEDIYIESVVAYTKNVEALAIHTGYMSTTPEIQTRKVFLQLSELKKLQKIYIEAGAEVYAKLIALLMDGFAKNKVPISNVNLREFSIGSKEIKSIFKLKTITLLALDEVEHVTDTDLVPLTKQLPLLQNLQLYFGRKTKTPITINGLTKMVKDGKHLVYVALVNIPNLKIDKKAFEGLLKAAQSRGNEKKLTIDIVGIKKTTSFNVPVDIQQTAINHLKILYTTT